LSRRDLNRASLWGSLGVVLVGSVLGLGAAWLAWLGAGDRLPVFVDNGAGVPPPRWPVPTAVVWPWSLAVALFVAVAVVAAVQVRRSVARNGGDH
jgi:membrane protein implicated in regulation of membrane protease activity